MNRLTAKITVRPMLEQDLAQVVAIEQACFPRPWTSEHFRHELIAAGSLPLVATLDDAIQGYLCLSIIQDEAEVLDIAVAPYARGCGIAVLLMDHGLSLARERGVERLFLEVRSSNDSAIGLYERYGFRRAGIRKQYYEGKEDALIMELQLPATTKELE